MNHPKALRFPKWSGEDLLRPLDTGGPRYHAWLDRQPTLIPAEWRLISSPALRCTSVFPHLFGRASYHVRVRDELYPVGNEAIDRLHQKHGHAPFGRFSTDEMIAMRVECRLIWERLSPDIPVAEEERDGLMICGHDIVVPGLAVMVAEMRGYDAEQIIQEDIGIGSSILLERDGRVRIYT